MVNIIFDLDDTLVSTAYVYRQCALSFLLELQKAMIPFPLDIAELMEQHEQTYCERLQTCGFDEGIFSFIWLDMAYTLLHNYFPANEDKELAASHAAVLQRLTPIINMYRTVSYSTITGVHGLLKALHNSPGVCLVCLTAGEEGIQQRKLDESRLAQYFHNVHIISKDKTEYLQEYVKCNNPVVMIGNSWVSDIYPAITAGVDMAILMQYGDKEVGWKYDQKTVDVQSTKTKVCQAGSMLDVYALLYQYIQNEKINVTIS